MGNTFFARRGGDAGAQKPAPPRTGQVYLDAQRRMLYPLNETARQLIREGIPFLRDDLERQPLTHLTGGPVLGEDLPLYRAWRESQPAEATFVLSRPGVATQHVTWNAAPLAGPGGSLQGVVASVTLSVPEPDWQELAGLAHDLRTPLQALRLLVPALEGMPFLNPEAGQVVERLRGAADRALALGLDLLEWARGPALNGRPMERAWFALGPALTALAAEQLPLAQRKGIALSVKLEAVRDVEVNTDRNRLGRLLANLLANAVRYTTVGRVLFSASWRAPASGDGATSAGTTDPSGRATSVASDARQLVLSVDDTGAGISSEDKESIFEAYERGKAGKESDSGGSGLGLAVVDRLVKELDLTLEVFSEYGHGSTFELIVPPGQLRQGDKVTR